MTVKEYGASSYLRAITADIEESLKRHYPQGYKELFVFSALKLLEQTPLKRFGFYFLVGSEFAALEIKALARKTTPKLSPR